MSGDLVGTLRYMSPEQALGQRMLLDHQTDLYSLGVTLYELLTLEPPFAGNDRQELLRQIAFEEPPSPRRQNKAIPAELDIIVLKAMEKRPADRYATAQELADDLRRYLEDKPIRARRPNVLARVRKWSWRHRGAVSAAVAATLLVLAATSGVIVWQWRLAVNAGAEARQAQALAEERFDLAKDAVDKYLNQVTQTPELKGANFHELRKKLLETALPFYQKLAEQAPGDPEREAARGRAYGRLGDIRFEMREYSFEPGEAEAALADYRAMHAIFARLAEAFPDEPDYRRDLTRSLIGQGVFQFYAGRSADSEAAYRAGLAVGQQLVTDFPSIAAYRSDLAKCRIRLSELLAWYRVGKIAEAEAEARAALKEQQRLVDEYPNNPDYRYELARSHNALGTYLGELQDKVAESEAEFRVALEQQRRLADEYPNIPKYRHYLARNLENMGDLLVRVGRAEQAEAPLRAALKEQWRVVGEHPYVSEYRDHLFRHLSHLVPVLAGQGKQGGAEGECREAIRLKPDAPQPHALLGELLAGRGQWEKASEEYRKAIELNPKNAVTWNARGRAYLELHQYDKALADYSKAIELDPKVTLVWVNRGLAYCRLHQYDKDLADYNKALALEPIRPIIQNNLALLLATCPEAKIRDPKRAAQLAEKAVKALPKDPYVWTTLGIARYRAGDWKGATQALEEALKLLRATRGFDREVGRSLFFLAMAQQQLGQGQEARQAYDRALAWLETNRKTVQETPRLADEVRRSQTEAEQLLKQRPEKKKPPSEAPRR
jgi:tetratricopeptide (TPR) repeat protein